LPPAVGVALSPVPVIALVGTIGVKLIGDAISGLST
jgi:hypothetical protein